MIVTALLAAASVTMVGPMRIAPADVCPAQRAFHASADTARLLRPHDRRGDAGAQTLKSLPPANLELAVERRVAGCAVPTIVREDVQGDGRFARPR
jgi:hypothetical protein